MTSPRLLYRRLLHAVDNYGLCGALQRLRQPTPEPLPPPTHPFDVLHHVDTSGHVPGEALVTGSSADLYNTAYWAISPSSLRQALAALPPAVDPAAFTFVDLGCGKGRALLLAADHGFGRVLGVELSPELAETARRNAAVYGTTRRPIEVRHQDAVTVDYPDTPLLVFLYHPFLAPVLRRVLGCLLAQHAASPRAVYLLFANPSYDRLISRFPLEVVWRKTFALSAEDAVADRHGITEERYILYRAL